MLMSCDFAVAIRRFLLGLGFIDRLSTEQQRCLVRFYNESHPDANIQARWSTTSSAATYFLDARAKFHESLILDGRRISFCQRVTNAPNSIVQTRLSGTAFVGQVIGIITQSPTGIHPASTTLLQIRWMRRLPSNEFSTELWDA